jgi:membrane fusion protein (multidrug efflux system)
MHVGEHLHCAGRARTQNVGDRLLKAGADVCASLGGERGLPRHAAHRRLKARERHVEPRTLQQRARQVNDAGIAAGCFAFDLRAAGHAQAQQPDGAATGARAAGGRKLLAPIIGGVVAVGALAAGGNWYLNGRFEIATDNAYVRSDITNVAAKLQGYVASVNISANQKVKAGDLLFSIDNADFKARLAEAEAALKQAQADVQQARARIAAQAAAVASAKSRAAAQRDQLTEAQATSDWQSSDLKRLSELAEKGWYPKARVEQAQSTEKAARAGVTAQRSQIVSAESAINQAQQEYTAATASAASADARVAAAQAKLDAARLDLSRTEVRAAIDGAIANNTVVPGALVSPGQQVVSIVPTDDAYIIANYKETQVARMAPRQHVRLKVDAYPDLKCTGTVDSIAPASGGTFSLIPQDTATGNFTKIVQRVPVKILIDKDCLATGKMRSGLSVVATISTKAS